jgi:regulator of sigma E protease
MNVTLCVILLTIGFAVGMPMATSELEGGIVVSQQQVQISQILEGSPAQIADLKVGDTILQADGQTVISTAGLKEIISQQTDQEVVLLIARDETQLEKKVAIAEIEGNIGIGVGIVDLGVVRYPIHLAIWQALQATWGWLVMMIMAIVALIKQLFGGPSIGVDFSGPVGIAVLTGQAAKLGWVYLLQFAALLSLNLAIINILPFPALDGGRILFLTIGKLRGKMIDSKWENFSHNAGFILLMILIVFITYRDLIKYGGKIMSALMRNFGF